MSRATIDAKWGPAYRMAEEGKSASEIARALGRTISGVAVWAKREGITLVPGKRGRKLGGRKDPTPERTAAMVEMFNSGATMQKIGEQYGVTRERVRQLLKRRADLTGKDSIKHAIVAEKAARYVRSMRSRKEDKWGTDYETWKVLRENGLCRAYEMQKKNARFRGVAWRLTLGDWYAIWQASGKLHLRGRGKGKYCMARIKDEGGYVLGNVHVQLATDNSRDAVKLWAGKTKPIKGVFCIYPGRPKAWLAKVGKVSIGYYESAELAGAAREAWIAEHPKPAKAKVLQLEAA